MKTKSLAVNISAVLIVIIVALIPFHALLTVFGSSLIGHYTLIRLWKEYLLAIIVLLAIYIFLSDKKVRELFYYSRLIQLILVFFVIELIWGLVAHLKKDVSTKALFYGWLSDCRYLVFFIVTLVIAKKTSLIKSTTIKLILWPAAIVIIFGLLEIFVLPKDFLSHFGYGANTILPYQTINSNSHYVRILSTLRGADPLGAYLIIPLSLVTVLLVRGRRMLLALLFLIAGIIVEIFSFSRSGWLGLAVAMLVAIYFGIKSPTSRNKLTYIFIALLIVIAGFLTVERHNMRVQNLIFHTQTNSAVKTTSDQNHASALKTGLKQLAREPLGKGPGSAGPASVYNNHPARIAENYYIQIGQEVGWLGLALYLAINVLVLLSLWTRRKDTLALAMLASFIGIFICNLLLLAWTDDTLSYLWWGMAALAIAYLPAVSKRPKKSYWLL